MIIYKNVKWGKDSEISENTVLGKPPRGKVDGELPLEIGNNSVIRDFTVIYAGTKIGDNFQTGHSALIRENNKIGNDVSVGTTAVLEAGNVIGNNVRIHSGCFLENVILGDNVFLGPNVVFTDDLHPPCPHYEDCKNGVIIEDNVSIGANATILPGIRIGRNSLIGAGSVVTKDVPSNSVVAGNPAKVIKKTDELTCLKGFYKKPYEWRKK